MATDGIVRKIDKLGRVVIPAEFRKSLRIELEEDVEIMMNQNTIVVQKYEKGCIFCGEKNATSMYHDKLICEECRKALVGD